MSAGYHHFVIEQGATFGQVLTLKDSSGTLINLTGYSSAEMDLRENPESSSVILTLTTANSRIARYMLKKLKHYKHIFDIK